MPIPRTRFARRAAYLLFILLVLSGQSSLATLGNQDQDHPDDSLARRGESPREVTKSEPLPNATGLRVGASQFRPPEELLQQLSGKADLDKIPLIPGLNLLSLPEEPATTDPAAVFNAIGGAYTRVWVHELCDTANPWKIYDPNDPAGTDLTKVDHTNGFWLEATSPVDLPSDGTLPATTTIELCPGWNLVGFPAAQPRQVTNALHSIEGKYLRVFGYDASDAVDPWEVFSVDVPEWANDLTELIPGRGYWILATEATTLTIANEGPAPIAEIASPSDLSVVTEITDIVGSVQSPILESWRLTYERIGETEPVEIGSGGAPVSGGVLGTFDPTLLINGLYELRLEAVDLDGQVVEDSIAVAVEGNMKIGHFALSFVDLVVPLSGLDIEIVRTYDSRQKDESLDFGHGWTLDIRQGSYQNNRPPGDGWQIVNPGGQFDLPCSQTIETKSHLTTIRLSDQEIYRFRLSLIETAILLEGCQARAIFEWVDGPLPGSTLEVLGDNRVIYENGSDRLLHQDTLTLFEPDDVRLRTRDGRIFHLNLTDGVTHLEDPNGNSVDITPDGITHSNGIGIDFVRDGDGRIARIIDTAGSQITYTYDSSGDLVRYEDRTDSAMLYRFQDEHHLTAIRSSEGKILLTTTFGEDGRIEQQCDGDLNCTQLIHNLDKKEERRIDPTARETVYHYDSRGNITLVVDGLGNETRYEHNGRDQMTRHIDPLGAVTTWEYEGSNLTRIVVPHPENSNPDDFTTQMEYDESGFLTRLDRPGGSSWSIIYDEQKNPIEIRDGEGRVLKSTTYDSRGNVTSESTRFGTLSYENLTAFGEPRRQIGPTGSLTEATYGDLGEVTSFTAGKLVGMFEHDSTGRETRAVYSDGLWHETTYDDLGRWAGDSNPISGSVSRRLDGAARLAAWELASGQERTFERDAAGRLVAETDPLGRRFENHYDAAGRLVTVTDPAGAATSFDLNAGGRAVRIINALDQATELEYWPDGRIKVHRDPMGNETTFRYGPSWTEALDALSRSVRTETGSEGELTKLEYPDGSVTRWTYVEDAPQGEKENYLTAYIDEAGESWSRSYDEVGFLASVSDPRGICKCCVRGMSQAARAPSTNFTPAATSETSFDAFSALQRF